MYVVQWQGTCSAFERPSASGTTRKRKEEKEKGRKKEKNTNKAIKNSVKGRKSDGVF